MFNQNKLKAQMVLKEMSAKNLADAMGINEITFYRKMRDNGRFTREEIATMIKVLEIEDPADIFFAEELA